VDTETFANILKESVYQGAYGPTATIYAAKFLTLPYGEDEWVFRTRNLGYYVTAKDAEISARRAFEHNMKCVGKKNPPRCYVQGAPPCDDPTCYHDKTLRGYYAERRDILLTARE
jgi:hypothetical protein